VKELGQISRQCSSQLRRKLRSWVFKHLEPTKSDAKTGEATFLNFSSAQQICNEQSPWAVSKLQNQLHSQLHGQLHSQLHSRRMIFKDTFPFLS
jgi:hypothetical protein